MQRVFVSDSFAVLQEAVVTAVKTVKDADPLAPVSVIVPSTLLATRLRRAIAWAGQGHFGLRLCTLTDFARDVAETTCFGTVYACPALAAPLLVKRLNSEARQPFCSIGALPKVRLLVTLWISDADISVAPARLSHRTP
jgi:hypothetical protein